MKKVIKIDGDEVTISSSEFNEVKVYKKSQFNFEPRVNDIVDVFGSEEEAVIGLASTEESTKQASQAKANGIMLLIAFILNLVTIISLFWLVIPLAWMIPMTVMSWKVYKGTRPNTIALGVCTLLFLNIVSGILLIIPAASQDN